MNPEKLKSSFEALERKKAKENRRKERRMRKLARRNERKEKRIRSYREYARSNKSIHERAYNLAGNADRSSSDREALIVLGKAKDDTHAVARVSYSYTSISQSSRFEFFEVKDEEALKEIQNNPSATHLVDEMEPATTEATYPQKFKPEYEVVYDLIEMGEQRSPKRAFSPITAIRRAVDERRIPARLDELESTMTMIEEAANNTELNPILAENLAISNSTIQQAISN